MSIIFVLPVIFIISTIFVNPNIVLGASLVQEQSSKVSPHQQLKIHVERTGGFIGNKQPDTIDIDTSEHDPIDPNTQQNISTLIDNANFFNLSQDSVAPSTKVKDPFNYTITVEDKQNNKSHTIKTTGKTDLTNLNTLVVALGKQVTIQQQQKLQNRP
jgi:hypothetical protein